MTAPRKSSRAVARNSAAHRIPASTPEPEPEPASGWPGVVRYALRDWQHTLRLCAIVVVVGALLLLAVRLGFRVWL